jgi:hypothetical protein
MRASSAMGGVDVDVNSMLTRLTRQFFMNDMNDDGLVNDDGCCDNDDSMSTPIGRPTLKDAPSRDRE